MFKYRLIMKKERILNIPNILTSLRVLITFVVIYLIFADYSLIWIAVFFIIGMLTDFFDGQIARRFNLKTEFGRRADMLADRILMGGTVIAFVIKLSMNGSLTEYYILQILLIMSREILSLPFSIVLFTSGKDFPHARWIGKITTDLQCFAFPSIILSISYSFFSFSIYLAIATGIVGAVSAVYFIHDVFANEEEMNKEKKLRKGKRA